MKKFRVVVYLFCFCLLLSCNSKTSNIDNDIIGDWYVISSDSLNIPYQEFYFIDSLIYRCDERIGIKHASKYFIKNDSLIIIDWTDGETFVLGKIDFKKDKIICSGNSIIIELKTLKNESFLLSELVNKEINEDDYYKGFNKRIQNLVSINH